MARIGRTAFWAVGFAATYLMGKRRMKKSRGKPGMRDVWEAALPFPFRVRFVREGLQKGVERAISAVERRAAGRAARIRRPLGA